MKNFATFHILHKMSKVLSKKRFPVWLVLVLRYGYNGLKRRQLYKVSFTSDCVSITAQHFLSNQTTVVGLSYGIVWDTAEYHSRRVTAEQILVGLGKPANRIECRCHLHDDATNEIGDQRGQSRFLSLWYFVKLDILTLLLTDVNA